MAGRRDNCKLYYTLVSLSIQNIPEEYVDVTLMELILCVTVGEEDPKRPNRMQHQTLNSELILSKEQLYDMFQQILGVKKFEHQLLFNALQVCTVDT